MFNSIKPINLKKETNVLFFIDTTPEEFIESPISEAENIENPIIKLSEIYKTNDRYFENPNPLLKCYKCNEYGHTPIACPNPYSKIHCSYCSEPGHKSFTCKQIVCYKCLGIGHKISNCRSDLNDKCKMCKRPNHKERRCLVRNGGLINKEKQDLTCFICREIGHVCCFEPGIEDENKFCPRCGEEGHFFDGCKKIIDFSIFY
ncbi:hypothetical protein SteCoe_16122 [Stentor coeruleus]|uniref:CCHC-type domain-containing protein n=1 Tax=Stentor coeruleus TaxID=5963 RepID=A0A1R2C228_9CILI|nr:hypothetical protein SteCoe_16122 [Stentor coeruleus]